MKYSWVHRMLKQHSHLLAAVITLQLVAALVAAAQPFYLQQLVAAVFESEHQSVLQYVLMPMMCLLLLHCVMAASQMIAGQFGSRLSSNLLKQLQMDFLTHSAALPISFFRSERAGELITRFNHDIGQVQNLLAGLGPHLLKELLTCTMLLVVIFVLCPIELAVGALFVVGIASGFVYWLNRKLMGYANQQREQWSGINHSFDELVRGIETIKAFSAEQRSANHFQQKTNDFRQLSLRYGKFSALWSPAGELLIRAGSLLPLLLAFVLISDGRLGIETFLVYFFCASLLMASVSSFANGICSVPPMLVGLENLACYFDLGKEQRSSAPILAGKKIHSIEFKDINYGYAEGGPVINNFNALFVKGKVNTLAGNNGAGKTSLVEILLGFAPLQGGEVLVNRHSLTHQQLAGLRGNTALVSSGQYLFEGTVRDNLLLANEHANNAAMESAIKAVGLGSQRNAIDLETILDPNGANLSDGERQKIIIARTLISDVEIIIFDEPLAHIDRFSEGKVVNTIMALSQSSLIIVISHRGEEYREEVLNRIIL